MGGGRWSCDGVAEATHNCGKDGKSMKEYVACCGSDEEENAGITHLGGYVRFSVCLCGRKGSGRSMWYLVCLGRGSGEAERICGV